MWDRLSAKIRSILRRENDPPKVRLEAGIGNADLWPLKVEHSVAPSDVKVAQGHLRVMEVEREILSHAIRRLYEAEADGRISKGELKSLLSGYKERMIHVRNTIQHDQSVVALYELEGIQADLVRLFNNHLGELNMRIGKLRSCLKLKPSPPPPPKEKRRKSRKRSKAPRRNEVEERIEKIRAEVDKTLERLGQIEIEA